MMKTQYYVVEARPMGDFSLLEIPEIRGLGLIAAVVVNVALWAGIGAAWSAFVS